MTATAQSLADRFAESIIQDAEFTPQVAEGVVDFTLDGKTFRVIVIEDTSDLEAVVVYRTRDVEEEEAAALGLTVTAREEDADA